MMFFFRWWNTHSESYTQHRLYKDDNNYEKKWIKQQNYAPHTNSPQNSRWSVLRIKYKHYQYKLRIYYVVYVADIKIVFLFVLLFASLPINSISHATSPFHSLCGLRCVFHKNKFDMLEILRHLSMGYIEGIQLVIVFFSLWLSAGVSFSLCILFTFVIGIRPEHAFVVYFYSLFVSH